MEQNRVEELKRVIDGMRSISRDFYYRATHLNNHPFIEFTGLINEYIQCCQRALDSGIDFTECNKHSGNHLPMLGHEISYVSEKLDCIFTGRILAKYDNGFSVGKECVLKETLQEVDYDTGQGTLYVGSIFKILEIYGEFCKVEHVGRVWNNIPLDKLLMIGEW